MDRSPILCCLLCAATLACAQPAVEPEPAMAPSSWNPPNAWSPPPKPGEPELHRAARVGDHDAIRRASAAGADLNAAFDIGCEPGARPNPATPLMVAAGSGDGATADTVRLLLQLGADPKVKLGDSTAAGFAATGLGWNYRPGGDAARLRLLLEAGSPLALQGEPGVRLVGDAASAGDADRLRVLIESGAPVSAWFDAAQAEAEAAQMQAMRRQYLAEQPPEVRAILESPEADISKVYKPRTGPWSFQIPLFQAAEGGSEACINLLLEAGADPGQLDSQLRTALFYATSAEAVRVLAPRVALDHTDEYDSDALENLLDELDADPQLDPSVQTAARAMIEVGIPLVLPPGSNRNRLYQAAFDENPTALRFLLDAGHPIAPGPDGRTALHAICWHWDHGDERDEITRSIIRTLLAAGIDPNARDAEGNTPLHECVSGDGANIVAAELLVEAGADVNAQNNDGQTPLVYLYETHFEYAKVVPFLLKHGADPLIPNARGQNALDLARATAAGEEPAWREEMLEDLPPDHPAQSTGWKSPAEPGDEESQVLKLLEEAAKRPRK